MRNLLIVVCVGAAVSAGCRDRRQERELKGQFCEAMAALDECSGVEGIACDQFWTAITNDCELITLPLGGRAYQDCLEEHVESMEAMRDECLDEQ